MKRYVYLLFIYISNALFIAALRNVILFPTILKINIDSHSVFQSFLHDVSCLRPLSFFHSPLRHHDPSLRSAEAHKPSAHTRALFRIPPSTTRQIPHPLPSKKFWLFGDSDSLFCSSFTLLYCCPLCFVKVYLFNSY